MVDFVDYAEDLVQGILVRGGAVNRAVRIHLGFWIYLTYDYYEGDGLFSIRQYYLIEGKEVAGKKGVSLRCGNFSKLIRTIQGQLAIGVKIKLRNLFLVENSIELVLRKRVLARAKGNCNACRQGFRVTHPEHQVGCLLDWAHIVQEQLILPEHLPDLAAEAKAVYKAALATMAFDDTKGALAHSFGYLYGKYFTNDAGTTTGPPQPAAEEEVEQPPAALPPASPDRLLGQGRPQGPSGQRGRRGCSELSHLRRYWGLQTPRQIEHGSQIVPLAAWDLLIPRIRKICVKGVPSKGVILQMRHQWISQRE